MLCCDSQSMSAPLSLSGRFVSAPRSIPAAWLVGLNRTGVATGDSDEPGAATTPVPRHPFTIASLGGCENT